MSTIKDVAKHVIDQLPDDANWADIMYRLYVRQKIDVALAVAGDRRTVEHETLKLELLGG